MLRKFFVIKKRRGVEYGVLALNILSEVDVNKLINDLVVVQCIYLSHNFFFLWMNKATFDFEMLEWVSVTTCDVHTFLEI